MSTNENTGPRRTDSLWIFLLVLSVVLGLWGGYWFWIIKHIPDNENAQNAFAMRGQFGDMFGAINALFSALASAVLVYTMWLQRIELKLQREELANTRVELTRSATAQVEQVEAMRSFAEAAKEQARAMESLASATMNAEQYNRQSADALREQARAMSNLAQATADGNARQQMDRMFKNPPY